MKKREEQVFVEEFNELLKKYSFRLLAVPIIKADGTLGAKVSVVRREEVGKEVNLEDKKKEKTLKKKKG